MNEEIFRKKNIDKLKSVENLEDYIKVSNPGIWLLIISIIALLIGFCVWGLCGHIDSTVPTVVCVENGKAYCYISEKDITSIDKGVKVKIGDTVAYISEIGEKNEQGYMCKLTDATDLLDGFYDGKVVIESYKPMSFILN